MKVYVHSAVADLKEVLVNRKPIQTGVLKAVVLEVFGGGKIKDVLKAYLEVIRKNFDIQDAPYRLEFFKQSVELSGNFPAFKIRIITEDDEICPMEGKLNKYIEDKGDVFIEIVLSEISKLDGKPETESKVKDDVVELLPSELHKKCAANLSKAEKFRDTKKYRDAKKYAQLVIDVLDEVADTTPLAGFEHRLKATYLLALIEYVNGRYGSSIRLLNPLMTKAKTVKNSYFIQVCELLGDSLYKQSRFKDSLGFYSKAKDMFPKKDGKIDSRHLGGYKMLEVKEALGILRVDETGSGMKHAMSVLGQVVSTEKPGTELYSVAAVEVSKLYYANGEVGKALHTSLTALVQDSNNKELKKEVSRLLGAHEQLVEAVLSMLESTSGAAASLAFIGNTLKEYSHIPQARIFLGKSVVSSNLEAQYVLGYVHLLELNREYTEALRECSKFCSKNSAFSISLNNFSVSCAQVGSIIDAALNKSFAQSNNYGSPLYRVETIQDDKDVRLCKVSVKKSEEWETLGLETIPKPIKKSFNDEEIQTLAIWFTAVKLLFLLGKLHSLPPLVALLEPIRIQQNLHLTLVRNEHAYYTLVSQLLPYFDDINSFKQKSANSFNGKLVYSFGDSHALSLAWKNVVSSNGEEMQIRPVLATGVKAWHLRKDSQFFPKYAFHEGAKSIPSASTVIFIFCEIDCREALAKAVEEAKYGSIEEGIKVVVDIYVDTLVELVQKKKFSAYVHPVLPVLDVTRPIVLTFNKALRFKVEQQASLTWLDIDILSADKKQVLSQYQLDGTHVNPTYFELLKDQIVLTEK